MRQEFSATLAHSFHRNLSGPSGHSVLKLCRINVDVASRRTDVDTTSLLRRVPAGCGLACCASEELSCVTKQLPPAL